MEHLVARPNLSVAGFMGAGIRPLNRDQVKKKIVTPGKNRYICHIESDSNNNYMSMTAKEHRAAVCKALNAFLEDRFPKVDSIPASARRRRVQAAEGEILTSEESLARLLEEEQARALAPKRRVGRPKGSVKSGPIDKFVSKTPPKKKSCKSPTQEKSCKSPTQEKSCNDLPTQEKSVPLNLIQDSIYTPPPTPILLSESDPDDPDYCAASTSKAASKRRPLRAKKRVHFQLDNDPTDDDPSTDDEDPPNRDTPPIVNTKLIRVNSHIIWDNEGTYYPAIVVKKFRTWCKVTNMMPHNVSNLSLWTYGAAQKQCYYGKIKALIKPPALQGTSSGRGIDGNAVYLVEKIAKYWPKV